MKDPGPRNGFRFSLVDYCRLVAELKPDAWASCDYCVEPEVIAQGPSIMDRIAGTVQNLSDLNELADWFEIPRPVPVLQGWESWHYEACLDMFHRFEFSKKKAGPPLSGSVRYVAAIWLDRTAFAKSWQRLRQPFQLGPLYTCSG